MGKEEKQKNLCDKYGISPEEFNAAVDELCARGVAKGCYQQTTALIAVLDLLSNGDLPAEVV